MVKTPEESDKLIYAETKFAMFVAELATDPERTRIFVFFFSDSDTVLLEYADPNLNLALLPRKNQHYILRRSCYLYLNFFWSSPEFWQKKRPNFG